jgi:hypothetical protein
MEKNCYNMNIVFTPCKYKNKKGVFIMKNALKIVALALVLVTMVAALASCGGPAKDPADAEKALKDNGYTVVKSDNLATAALALAGVKDVESVVSGSATIDDKFETVTIFYFEDKDAANEAWEDAQKYADEKKDDKSEDWVVKKSGAMIYFGTPNAVKAAK